MKFNLRYLIAFISLFMIEFFIALFAHDNFIRPYLGDVLVVILIYCLIRIFLLKKVMLLPLYIFLFAVVVETLQYFNIVQLLHMEKDIVARVIIGTSFSFLDILCYLAGCLILVGFQFFIDYKDRKSKA